MLSPEILEVVRLLPSGAANALHVQTPSCQMYVCQALRIVFDEWRRDNIVLDPIQFEAVASALVAMAIQMHKLKVMADGPT